MQHPNARAREEGLFHGTRAGLQRNIVLVAGRARERVRRAPPCSIQHRHRFVRESTEHPFFVARSGCRQDGCRRSELNGRRSLKESNHDQSAFAFPDVAVHALFRTADDRRLDSTGRPELEKQRPKRTRSGQAIQSAPSRFFFFPLLFFPIFFFFFLCFCYLICFLFFFFFICDFCFFVCFVFFLFLFFLLFLYVFRFLRSAPCLGK